MWRGWLRKGFGRRRVRGAAMDWCRGHVVATISNWLVRRRNAP